MLQSSYFCFYLTKNDPARSGSAYKFIMYKKTPLFTSNSSISVLGTAINAAAPCHEW